MRSIVWISLAMLAMGATPASGAGTDRNPFTNPGSPIYGLDRAEFEAKWAKKCQADGHKPGTQGYLSCMAGEEERVRILFRPRGKGR